MKLRCLVDDYNNVMFLWSCWKSLSERKDLEQKLNILFEQIIHQVQKDPVFEIGSTVMFTQDDIDMNVRAGQMKKVTEDNFAELHIKIHKIKQMPQVMILE